VTIGAPDPVEGEIRIDMVTWLKKGPGGAKNQASGETFNIKAATPTFCIVLGENKPGNLVGRLEGVGVRRAAQLVGGCLYKAPGSGLPGREVNIGSRDQLGLY